jgi:hypothetical protein
MLTHDLRGSRPIAMAMLALCALARPARGQEAQRDAPAASAPLSWSGTLPDADGVPRSIEFKGSVSGGVVEGSIFMEGNELTLVGNIQADGSVDGLVKTSSGAELGHVRMARPATAVRDAASKRSDFAFDLGGRSGGGSVSVTPQAVDAIAAGATAAPAQ